MDLQNGDPDKSFETTLFIRFIEQRQTPDESFGKRPPALCIDLQNRDKSPMNPSLNYEFRDL
jgi:hypothetical protein